MQLPSKALPGEGQPARVPLGLPAARAWELMKPGINPAAHSAVYFCSGTAIHFLGHGRQRRDAD